MARLIIEAVSNQKGVSQDYEFRICVSVSSAASGAPVTGLSKSNFEITNLEKPSAETSSSIYDYDINVEERTWDPYDNGGSGVYDQTFWRHTAKVSNAAYYPFHRGNNFALGVQVIIIKQNSQNDLGQTVVSILLPNEW